MSKHKISPLAAQKLAEFLAQPKPTEVTLPSSSSHYGFYQYKKNGTKEFFVSPRNLAKQFGVSTKWLERARTGGYGPPWIKVNGSVRYVIELLDAWVILKLAEQGFTPDGTPLTQPL